MSSNTQYKPGDVANGYVLTEGNEWIPLPPPPVAAKPKKPVWVRWYMIVVYVVVGLVVIGQLAGGSDEPVPAPVASADEAAALERPVAESPADEAPAEGEVEDAPAPAEQESPAPVEEDAGVVGWGQRFDTGDGSWISVSKPRHETGVLDDPITVVDITLHNGTDETVEVDMFTIFAEAMHGENGKTAEWAILDSTPIDGAALPGRSVTGEYAFEGRLDNPVVVQVEAWGATAYFG